MRIADDSAEEKCCMLEGKKADAAARGVSISFAGSRRSQRGVHVLLGGAIMRLARMMLMAKG